MSDRTTPLRLARRLGLAATAATLLSASAGFAADTFIRIGSGLAGTYPIVGAKMAELINENIEGVEATTVSGGTSANFVRLQDGEIEMLLTYSFLSGIVRDDGGSLGVQVPKVRHLMTLYGAFFQPIAAEGSGITSLSQVAEGPNRVWGANRTSIFYPMIEAALRAHDVEIDDITAAGGVVESIGYGDTAQAMQDGRLDVGFFAGPAPYSLMLQVEDNPGFELLGFSEEAAAKFAEMLPGARAEIIPAGTYKGQDEDKLIPYVVNQLVISSEVSDDLAYQITKVLVENHEEFHGLFAGAQEIVPAIALDNNPVEVHPGAARYYEEAGITAR
jgi:TRAP transporter TAXI family solute receptor